MSIYIYIYIYIYIVDMGKDFERFFLFIYYEFCLYSKEDTEHMANKHRYIHMYTYIVAYYTCV